MGAATLNPPVWPIAQLHHAPAFAPLRSLLSQTQWQTFPTRHMWAALPKRPYTSTHQPIQFIKPALITLPYEAAIAQYGHVATRGNNWHDCFNACTWFIYPKIKAALNALHMHVMASSQNTVRCRIRDAATLFDESGVLLPCCDKHLVQALHTHDWHTLFQTEKAAWGNQIDALLIGHANFEKALNPYIGWTGKAWPVAVPPCFFQQSLFEQCNILDTLVSDAINQQMLFSTQQLLPLPLLGIPGWWPLQDQDFYANTDYFRA